MKSKYSVKKTLFYQERVERWESAPVFSLGEAIRDFENAKEFHENFLDPHTNATFRESDETFWWIMLPGEDDEVGIEAERPQVDLRVVRDGEIIVKRKQG